MNSDRLWKLADEASEALKGEGRHPAWAALDDLYNQLVEAAREEQQREEAEPHNCLPSLGDPCGDCHRCRTPEEAGAVPLDEDDYREAKAEKASAHLAAAVGPVTLTQRWPPWPDPLDEDDHRDRVGALGERIVRVGHKHWHTPGCAKCRRREHGDHGYSLEDWNASDGPITFAPDTDQETTDDARKDRP